MQLLAAVRISVIVEHELQWGKSCLKSLEGINTDIGMHEHC